MDIKGRDILHEGQYIVLSQMAYLSTKGKAKENKTEPSTSTKIDLLRELIDAETTNHRTAAGLLAWIATGTSLSSFCLSIMSMKGKKRTVSLLQRCKEAYEKVATEHQALHSYVQLDFDTMQIRVSSNGSFQNLPDNHSLIGFLFLLADVQDR